MESSARTPYVGDRRCTMSRRARANHAPRSVGSEAGDGGANEGGADDARWDGSAGDGGTDDARCDGGADDAHADGGADDARTDGGADDARCDGGADDARCDGGADDARSDGGANDGGADDARWDGGAGSATAARRVLLLGAEVSPGSMWRSMGLMRELGGAPPSLACALSTSVARARAEGFAESRANRAKKSARASSPMRA